MQTEVGPGLGLSDEILPRAGQGQDLGLGTLDGQVHVPLAVVDLVDFAETAFAINAGHLVPVEDHIADGPINGYGLLSLDKRLLSRGCLSVQRESGLVLAHVHSLGRRFLGYGIECWIFWRHSRITTWIRPWSPSFFPTLLAVAGGHGATPPRDTMLLARLIVWWPG
jgi:hypothetical protein